MLRETELCNNQQTNPPLLFTLHALYFWKGSSFFSHSDTNRLSKSEGPYCLFSKRPVMSWVRWSGCESVNRSVCSLEWVFLEPGTPVSWCFLLLNHFGPFVFPFFRQSKETKDVLNVRQTQHVFVGDDSSVSVRDVLHEFTAAKQLHQRLWHCL